MHLSGRKKNKRFNSDFNPKIGWKKQKHGTRNKLYSFCDFSALYSVPTAFKISEALTLIAQEAAMHQRCAVGTMILSGLTTELN